MGPWAAAIVVILIGMLRVSAVSKVVGVLRRERMLQKEALVARRAASVFARRRVIPATLKRWSIYFHRRQRRM